MTFDLYEHEVLEGHSAVVGRLLGGGDVTQTHAAELLLTGQTSERSLGVLRASIICRDNRANRLLQRNVSMEYSLRTHTGAIAPLRLHPPGLQLSHVQTLLRVLVSDVFSGCQQLQRVPGGRNIP